MSRKDKPDIENTVIALLKEAKAVDPSKADDKLYDLCVKLGIGKVACFTASKTFDTKPENLTPADINTIARSLAKCDTDGNGSLTVGEIKAGTKNDPELVTAMNKFIPGLKLPMPKTGREL